MSVMEYSPVVLARGAVETYILINEIMKTPVGLPEELAEQAGVFVSIKAGSELRGCIGTIKPRTSSIGAEIINNAISAATKDPRFCPVCAAEIGNLKFSVDILLPEERISDISELDPFKYGVIVKNEESTGLLLPNIEGVDTAEQQVAIAAKKAMIFDISGLKIYRFEVKRFQEDNGK